MMQEAERQASDGADIDRNLLQDIRQEQQAAKFLRRDSNLERIEEAARKYMYNATTYVVAEAATCLDREILLAMVRETRKANLGLLSLPFSIAFFMLFAFSAFLHEDVTTVYEVESGVRSLFGAGAAEVSSPATAYQWLGETLLPAFFVQTDIRGKPIADKAQWHTALSYNHLVGPVVLEQERSTVEVCAGKTVGLDNGGADLASDMLCYSSKTTDTSTYGRAINWAAIPITAPVDGEHAGGNVTLAERTAFYERPFSVAAAASRRLRVTREEFQGRLAGTAVGFGSSDVFRAEFFANSPYALSQERFNYLYERGWIDKQTKHVKVRAMLINGEVGRPRLESYQLILSFSRSGEVFAKLIVDTLFLEFWNGNVGMASDFVWVMMLMGATLFEMVSLCKKARERQLLKTMKTPWFILQWSILVIGWFIVAGYAFINLMMVDVKKDLLAARDVLTADTPPEQNALGIELMDVASGVNWYYMYLRLCIAQYHLLLMMRFFVSFRSQPRLGIVIQTLEVCLLDIIHFLVILVPVYAAYAISGCFIYGRRIEEFATIQGSMGICFKFLMETEFDWPLLAEEHFWTSAMWTWSFMVFLGMLMLNMVLAIVLDAYAEQRKLGGKRETIWQTFYGIVTVFRHWKRWVGTDKLQERFQQMNRFVTREDFLKVFPGMPEAQAELIMAKAQTMSAAVNAGPEHWKQVMRMAMALVVTMDRITDDVSELSTGTYVPAEDDASMKCKATTWLTEISQEMASQSHQMLALQWRLQQLQWAVQTLDMAHGKKATFDLSAPGWFGLGKADDSSKKDVIL